MKSILSTIQIQMALFTESPVVPQWNDLEDVTRIEVVKLLARLLMTVQSSAGRALSGRGANDE